jgi:hypothetical protein
MTLPVPKKDELGEHRRRFSHGLNVQDIMSFHRIQNEPVIEGNGQDEEFNFECEEGLERTEVELIER